MPSNNLPQGADHVEYVDTGYSLVRDQKWLVHVGGMKMEEGETAG